MKESFRHFEPNKTFDLIGLGNAIVDIIVNIEDEFLEINNLDKGSMNLINSCLLYTSPSPRDVCSSRMPSSA